MINVNTFSKALIGLAAASLLASSVAAVEIPEITGEPKVVGQQTLQWLREGGDDVVPEHPHNHPSLTGRANVLDDLHGVVDTSHTDLSISTAGNFHRFLNAFMRNEFLPANPEVNQYFYSTSPPVSVDQTSYERLSFGNLTLQGRPMVAMGPKSLMNKLSAMGYTASEPRKILSNHGNVLLVRKGNPKRIQNIWSLGRRNVRVATSNPTTEPGSFGNYASSLFHITFWQVFEETGNMDYAEKLATKFYNRIFNGKKGRKDKWVVGDRIHHRDVPQLIADGDADVAPIFYHLAQTAIEANPDMFEMVPLGGSIAEPEPVTGNKVATMFVVKIDGDWTTEQLEHQDRFYDAISSHVSNEVLLNYYWVRQPVTTGNNQPSLPE